MEAMERKFWKEERSGWLWFYLVVILWLVLMPLIASAEGVEAVPVERRGVVRTYTWTEQTGNTTGTTTYLSGGSTYVRGLLWQVSITSTGVSSYANGASFYLLNAMGEDVLGTGIGKTMNAGAGTTVVRTPLLSDGTYRWMNNQWLTLVGSGVGLARTFVVTLRTLE